MLTSLEIICRMEKVDMKRVRCQAKVVGTVVTVAGAMVMTLYKGPIVDMMRSRHSDHQTAASPTPADDSADKNWVKGSIFLIIATMAWAALFIIQVEEEME